MSLNKEFLEEVLVQPISDFEVSEGAKPGDNVAGSLKSVKVTTVANKTLNLVYKGLPDTPEGKDYAVRFNIFRTESTMYTTVRSKVEALLEIRGVKRTELPMPKFFSGQYTDEHFYLLLEDVRPEGYIMPDKFKGLNLSEVTLIMKEMARFHASTYFLIKYEGEKVFDHDENMSAIRDSFIAMDAMKPIFILMFENEMKNAIKILQSQDQEESAQKLQNILEYRPDELFKLLKRTSKLTDSTMFPCIVHGDLWMNNIMIKYDASENAIDLKFLDFQQSRRGNIFEDLEYFFMCSTTPEFRKEHLPNVLNVYYDAFVSTLEELRSPIPIGFTRGSLIDTFYQGLLPAYLYMTFAIPLQLAEPLDVSSNVDEAPAEQNGTCGDGDIIIIPDGRQNGLSMEEMMAKNLEMRSKMLFGQMMKSPKAIDRLVDITREMVEMKIL